MFSRKRVVPKSNEKKQINVVQLWEIRWRSRYGEYSNDTQDEIEIFFSEREAEEFRISLRNAFRLIRHTSGTRITITKLKDEK